LENEARAAREEKRREEAAAKAREAKAAREAADARIREAAARRRSALDKTKAKIKEASKSGKAVGLAAALGVNLDFNLGGRRKRDAAAEEAPAPAEPRQGYVPDGLTAAQFAEVQAKDRARTAGKDLGAWGSKVGGASGPQRGDIMSQPTIWTNPAKFFREDQKLPYAPAQSDESRPNILSGGGGGFEKWQSKLIDGLEKKYATEPEPEAEPVPIASADDDSSAAVVNALGAVAAAGAGALVVAGIVEAETAMAVGAAGATVLGAAATAAVNAAAAKGAEDDSDEAGTE